MLLHRKKESREARSRSADAVVAVPRRIRRIALEAKHELRTRQHPPQSHLDAAFKGAVVPFLLVETEQRFKVGVGNRFAIGEPRQSRNDLARAGHFFGGGCRVAGENPAPAGRIAGALRIERPANAYVDAHRGRPRGSLGSNVLRSSGSRRSSTGPNDFFRNAAVTVCGPAFTKARASSVSGGWVMLSFVAATGSNPPFATLSATGFACSFFRRVDQRCVSGSRSPFNASSSVFILCVASRIEDRRTVDFSILTLNTYSPSSGNSCGGSGRRRRRSQPRQALDVVILRDIRSGHEDSLARQSAPSYGVAHRRDG